MKHDLFVMSAPSGAGKTTLKDLVIHEFPDMVYSISATTRPARDEFQKMIANDELVEWNEVHGNFYGTPKSFVEKMLADGKRVLFDLDVFGKVNFDKVYPDAVGILILPPSLQVLEERLRHRATDSEEVIELRLHNAKKEIEFAEKHGKYEHTIINDDLERAADQLRKIFLE